MRRINRKLFGQVYDYVVAHPELHDQADWTNFNECGTSHCVGGWALHFYRPDQSLWKTADDLVGPTSALSTGAAQLLGLNELEASRLFYDTSDEQAVELCRRYATGGRKSADRYIRKIEAEEDE